MKSRVYMWTSRTCTSFCLLLIFSYLMLMNLACQQMNWMLRYLQELWKGIFTMTSKGLPGVIGPESSAARLAGTSIRRPDIYQTWLKRKYGEFEDAYYLEIDELRMKLRDLNKTLPEVRLQEFAFVSDWLHGIISSQEAYEIFKGMNIEDVANVRITRRLTSFMMQQDDTDNTSDMVKYVISGLKAKDGAVEKYVKYLNMLRKFFEVLSAIDSEQVPVTWLEQTLPEHAAGNITTRIADMPINQAIRQLDYYVIRDVESSYFIGDNIVVMDEIKATRRIIHWIFATKNQIDTLKILYKVKESLKQEEEKAYLIKLLEGY